ncbi:unnamed protein product [Calicophoron daubneyi]
MPSVMWVNAGPDEAPVYPSDCLNAKTYSGPFKTMDYPSPTRLVTKSNSQSALNQIRSVEWSSIRPSSNSSHRQLSSSERSLASQSRIRGGRTYSRDLPVTGAKTTFTADFSRGNVNDPHWRTVRIDVADPEGVRSFRRNRQYNVQTKNIPANPNSTVTDYLGGANELDQLDDAGDDEIAEICAKKLSPPNFDFTEAISGKKHGRKIPTLLEYSEDDVDSTTLSNSMKEAYGGKIKSSSTSNLRVAQSADRKQNSRPKDIGSYQSVKNSQEYRRKTIEIVRISSPSSHAQSAEEVDNRSPSISSNNSLNLQKTQVESTGTKSLHLDCSKEGQNSRSQNELRHKSTDSTEINIDTQKGSEIIYVNRPVTLLCLGPGAECRPASSDSMISGSREQLDECVALPHPLWVAVCTDNSSVSVFDLKTRRKKCSCFEHTCQSASPVIALIPFAYKSGNCISPDGDSVQGLLCIARKGGYLTLYNVSTCRVVGHLVLEHDILYAFPLLPCDPDASLMVISPDGQVVRCFWEITGYSEGQLFPKYTHWEGITKDMGANIVNVLSEKEKTNDFKCCICLQRATQSAASSPPNSSLISRKSLSNAYLLVAVSFIRAEKDLSILRICSWAARCNQLKLASCVDKAWNGASCSELVGVSYSELGGAPSVCICLKTEIIWLSLKSLDIVSSLKLPLCSQPVGVLASKWPHASSTSWQPEKVNERLWIGVAKGHLLEVSAFESQRRRDFSGRGCLPILHTGRSDSEITSVTCSTSGREIVIAGTNKGEIHIVGVPKVLFACRMAGCLFGFPTKEDILYHLIRDHYMNDSGMANGDETHCSWPDCDFSIEDSEGRVNEEKLERHALQHLSSL